MNGYRKGLADAARAIERAPLPETVYMAISDQRRRERLEALGVKWPSVQRNIATPEGEPKMSAVILSLADPLLKRPDTTASRAEWLIALAVAAWNKSILPADHQPEMERDLIDVFVPKDGYAESVGTVIPGKPSPLVPDVLHATDDAVAAWIGPVQPVARPSRRSDWQSVSDEMGQPLVPAWPPSQAMPVATYHPVPKAISVPQPQAPPAYKQCSFCGEQVLEVAKKCKHCGETIDVALRAAEEAQRMAQIAAWSTST